MPISQQRRFKASSEISSNCMNCTLFSIFLCSFERFTSHARLSAFHFSNFRHRGSSKQDSSSDFISFVWYFFWFSEAHGAFTVFGQATVQRGVLWHRQQAMVGICIISILVISFCRKYSMFNVYKTVYHKAIEEHQVHFTFTRSYRAKLESFEKSRYKDLHN